MKGSKMRTQQFPISIRKTGKFFQIQIRKDNFESFMNSCGFFRKDFLSILKQSKKDHDAGKVTKRKSLKELIN